MFVAIKTTVIDRIRDRIAAIRRDGREPEYVVVSDEEYDEMRGDRRVYRYLEYPRITPYIADTPITATLKVYDFEKRGARYGDPKRNIRAYSRETFMGLPLLVVPSEYVPL